MSVVDDLVANLVERNGISLTGGVTVSFVEGGVKVTGRAVSTLRDLRKNKDLLNVTIPIVADVKVGEVVIPVPLIP